jgi:phytoene dehydrogenase-like protein
MAEASYDVVVVGAGPNGLAAAVALARESLSVLVVEARSTAGGGCRSGPLAVPGVVHDLCSAVHPLAAASPFFLTLPLARHGLRWVEPKAPLAHVLEKGRAVVLERSIDATADRLGNDGPSYRRLVAPFVERFTDFMRMVLGPPRFPADPLLLARFGWRALLPMTALARRFAGEPARALLAGIAAHSMLPLEAPATTAFALVLGTAAHAVGWPVAAGGSQAITNALVAHLRELGGRLECDRDVATLSALPRARAYVLDLAPREVLRIAADRLPSSYRRRLARFRYGPGVFKMDWVLSGAIPWADPECSRAGTVHLGGSLAEVASAEAAVHAGRVAARPFVLLAQPSLFDPTRAPDGIHTAWAYCHVPHGWSGDASSAIEGLIEHHAPGFKALVVARTARTAVETERYNPNYVGGDIQGGASDLRQLFFRPVFRLDPYATPAPDLFLCSSSTPPGGGVHGMCGYWAAKSVLRRAFHRAPPPV